MRQQFPFYKSFDDIVEDLTDTQLAKYIRVLLDVQFLRIKIDDVKFDDKTLNIVWKSQKHSIAKSIKGFLDGQKREGIKNPYLGVYDENYTPSQGVNENNETPSQQVQVQEQCKGEVQVKEEVKPLGGTVATKSFDDSIRIANYLLNNILRINPVFKKPNINAWAKDIDKAIRIDGRSVQELKDCIDWIYSPDGSFWQKNILSGKKLREKFDTMNMQVIAKTPTKEETEEVKRNRVKASVMLKRGYSESEVKEALGL